MNRMAVERTLAIVKPDAVGRGLTADILSRVHAAEFMSSGKAVVMVLEAENGIAKWRETMGATDPAKAAAGTIRKELGESIQFNCTHGSDAEDTAAYEIGYFFSGAELV